MGVQRWTAGCYHAWRDPDGKRTDGAEINLYFLESCDGLGDKRWWSKRLLVAERLPGYALGFTWLAAHYSHHCIFFCIIHVNFSHTFDITRVAQHFMRQR